MSYIFTRFCSIYFFFMIYTARTLSIIRYPKFFYHLETHLCFSMAFPKRQETFLSFDSLFIAFFSFFNLEKISFNTFFPLWECYSGLSQIFLLWLIILNVPQRSCVKGMIPGGTNKRWWIFLEIGPRGRSLAHGEWALGGNCQTPVSSLFLLLFGYKVGCA
jgi:hypothetical protein